MSHTCSPYAASDWDVLNDTAASLVAIPLTKKAIDDDQSVISAGDWVEISYPEYSGKGRGLKRPPKGSAAPVTTANRLALPTTKQVKHVDEASAATQHDYSADDRDRCDTETNDADDEATTAFTISNCEAKTFLDTLKDVPLRENRLYRYLESLPSPEDLGTTPDEFLSDILDFQRHMMKPSGDGLRMSATAFLPPPSGLERYSTPPPCSQNLEIAEGVPGMSSQRVSRNGSCDFEAKFSSSLIEPRDLSMATILNSPSTAETGVKSHATKNAISKKINESIPCWRDPSWWLKKGLATSTTTAHDEKWLPPHLKAKFRC